MLEALLQPWASFFALVVLLFTIDLSWEPG
jgi:hypothetical protein